MQTFSKIKQGQNETGRAFVSRFQGQKTLADQACPKFFSDAQYCLFFKQALQKRFARELDRGRQKSLAEMFDEVKKSDKYLEKPAGDTNTFIASVASDLKKYFDRKLASQNSSNGTSHTHTSVNATTQPFYCYVCGQDHFASSCPHRYIPKNASLHRGNFSRDRKFHSSTNNRFSRNNNRQHRDNNFAHTRASSNRSWRPQSKNCWRLLFLEKRLFVEE